jgi:hypothetical protein
MQMPLVLFKDVTSGENNEIDYPHGAPLPKSGDEIFAPGSERVVKVLDVVRADKLEVHFLENASS